MHNKKRGRKRKFDEFESGICEEKKPRRKRGMKPKRDPLKLEKQDEIINILTKHKNEILKSRPIVLKKDMDVTYCVGCRNKTTSHDKDVVFGRAPRCKGASVYIHGKCDECGKKKSVVVGRVHKEDIICYCKDLLQCDEDDMVVDNHECDAEDDMVVDNHECDS